MCCVNFFKILNYCYWYNVLHFYCYILILFYMLYAPCGAFKYIFSMNVRVIFPKESQQQQSHAIQPNWLTRIMNWCYQSFKLIWNWIEMWTHDDCWPGWFGCISKHYSQPYYTYKLLLNGIFLFCFINILQVCERQRWKC